MQREVVESQVVAGQGVVLVMAAAPQVGLVRISEAAAPQVGLVRISEAPKATQPGPVMAPTALPLVKVTVVPVGMVLVLLSPAVAPPPSIVPPVGAGRPDMSKIMNSMAFSCAESAVRVAQHVGNAVLPVDGSPWGASRCGITHVQSAVDKLPALG